jgi:hypothetical protein
MRSTMRGAGWRRPPRRRRAHLGHDRARNSKPRRLTIRFEPERQRLTLRLSTMSNDQTFTILSTNAPLVEVNGDGPIADVQGGLAIPDGAATTARLSAPIRRWRVDAPPVAQTAVVVTDSPYGAFVGVRRCVSSAAAPKWWRALAADRWPRLRAVLKRCAPSALALWHLFTDDVRPCTWRDVGEGLDSHAQARGGDLVVVNFVSP